MYNYFILVFIQYSVFILKAIFLGTLQGKESFCYIVPYCCQDYVLILLTLGNRCKDIILCVKLLLQEKVDIISYLFCIYLSYFIFYYQDYPSISEWDVAFSFLQVLGGRRLGSISLRSMSLCGLLQQLLCVLIRAVFPSYICIASCLGSFCSAFIYQRRKHLLNLFDLAFNTFNQVFFFCRQLSTLDVLYLMYNLLNKELFLYPSFVFHCLIQVANSYY